MIITKTPYRVSLFGGGSDHPAWFKENGGEVISLAIDKYCYLSTRVLPPFFDHKFRIVYSKIEMPNSYLDIKHPAVRMGIKRFAPNDFLEIQHHGDLPARSGVGSSSAFAVGLIHSLKLLKGGSPTPSELANDAIELEQVDLMENVGSQDQIACALGGVNSISFHQSGKWEASPISLGNEYISEIEERMVLVFSGISRISSDISKNFLVDLKSKAKSMNRTIELARECTQILNSGADLDQIGEMLNESWGLKRALNPDSVNSKLEDLWDRAKLAGALGGKVLGAGGGGFCMFWVKRGERENFVKKLGSVVHVPAKISFTGSTCLLNSTISEA